MVAKASFRTRAGQPGPDLIWFAPLFVLILFAFAVFYYLNAWIAVFGLTLALTAAVLRRRLPPDQALFIAAIYAVIGVSMLAAFYKQSPEIFDGPKAVPEKGAPPINRFGFINNSRPFYRDPLPPIDRWFNLNGFDRSASIPHATRIEKEDFTFLSGDVLIESFSYERSTKHGALAACDARCMTLLELPKMTSVTVKPDRSVFWEGPRALMPGIKPIGQTFRIASSEQCQTFWYEDEHGERTKPGNLVQAVRQGRYDNAVTSWCLKESTTAPKSFDHRLTGKEF